MIRLLLILAFAACADDMAPPARDAGLDLYRPQLAEYTQPPIEQCAESDDGMCICGRYRIGPDGVVTEGRYAVCSLNGLYYASPRYSIPGGYCGCISRVVGQMDWTTGPAFEWDFFTCDVSLINGCE